MNFWKQTTHVMSYFKEESFRGDKRLPSSFMSGFLEVSELCPVHCRAVLADPRYRAAIEDDGITCLCIYLSRPFVKDNKNLETPRKPLHATV